MKEYICSVCGYVHKTDGELPKDFVCPICGAGRDAFYLKEEGSLKQQRIEKSHLEKELSSMEMSVICSNLARGCEKQYLPEQAEAFKSLAEFFKAKAGAITGDVDSVLALIEKDLSGGYPYANQEAKEISDRGALRALVWSEKVTRMLNSLLARYKQEGDRMLENTGVYVCTICGFVYVGDEPPKLCPVCKVPDWKFEKVERRTK